jgi:small subunit ribosomal protein S6
MKYEFMGILKPFLPEDVRSKLQQSIEKIFTSRGGKIQKRDMWGKRHFAYKIKGHEEGYYILIMLDLPSDALEEIQSELRVISDLLRYTIIKKDI